MSGNVNPEKVIARMAQQIGALHAELALHAEALEMAEARIAELENPADEAKPARPKAA